MTNLMRTLGDHEHRPGAEVLGRYLAQHRYARLLVFFICLVVSSYLQYSGAGVYLFTMGPNKVGSYVFSRFMAVTMMIIGFAFNFVMALMLQNPIRRKAFLLTLFACLVLTLSIAGGMFLVVWGRFLFH